MTAWRLGPSSEDYDGPVPPGYYELEEAARRMNLPVEEVIDLANRRQLRSVDIGFGLVCVQVAKLSGSV